MRFAVPLLLLVLLASCSVERRHYRPGFYVGHYEGAKSVNTVSDNPDKALPQNHRVVRPEAIESSAETKTLQPAIYSVTQKVLSLKEKQHTVLALSTPKNKYGELKRHRSRQLHYRIHKTWNKALKKSQAKERPMGLALFFLCLSLTLAIVLLFALLASFAGAGGGVLLTFAGFVGLFAILSLLSALVCALFFKTSDGFRKRRAKKSAKVIVVKPPGSE